MLTHTTLDHTLRLDDDFEVVIGWQTVSQTFGEFVFARPTSDNRTPLVNINSDRAVPAINAIRPYTEIPDGLQQQLWVDRLFNGSHPGQPAQPYPSHPSADPDTQPGDPRLYEVSWPDLGAEADLG